MSLLTRNWDENDSFRTDPSWKHVPPKFFMLKSFKVNDC